MAIFAKLKLIDFSATDFEKAVFLLKGFQKKIDATVSTPSNDAKLLARRFEDLIPILMGAGVMYQVARHWALSFNENAKTAAYIQEIPEMNHNGLVGLEFPKQLGQKIFVIIFQSNFDHPRIKLREKVMTQIFQKRRIPFETISIDSATSRISELLQILLFGAYTTFYLAILNNVNPFTIEMVDFLKAKLAEQPMNEV